MHQQKRVHCCDLVMKGGVTSGVVYPGAIQEIAKQFHLVGIGGTSAGAIAAAVAAAAEYRRRQTGSMEGFNALSSVSSNMSNSNRLLALFTPDASTKDHFDLAKPFLTGDSGWWAQTRLIVKLLWRLCTKRRRERFFQPIIANNFGVCSGMANDNPGSDSALTEWLCEQIDSVSGTEPGHHLTFKDLHEARIPVVLEQLLKKDAPSIDFRAVSTCLTFNRPFEFPLSETSLAYDADEWKKIFPASVMKQLDAASKKVDGRLFEQSGKLTLPTLDLPIIVAARLSLSFPILFSAVPLWAVNHNKAGSPVERVWFSDGGITSNFPVHRFDAIYPRWPTLAINFKSTGDDRKPLRKALLNSNQLIYMNTNRDEGVVDMWSSINQQGKPQASFFAFLFSIFRSAQNWHDNSFLRLPAFRDRVAEVWLRPDEGGLNLKMKEEVVNELTNRGIAAGIELTTRYSTLDSSDEMSWEGHKWTRFRSGMEGLSETIKMFKTSVGVNGLDESDLAKFLSNNDAPPCFQFEDDARREAARKIVSALYGLAKELEDLKAFDDGPRPQTEIGTRAPI